MGTIGFEYALFGKTVVNASINNPHYDYNFNVNPKNFKEYDRILNSLEKYKKIKIDKNKIFEYYFMMHIFHPKNWIFKNIDIIEKKNVEVTQRCIVVKYIDVFRMNIQ